MTLLQRVGLDSALLLAFLAVQASAAPAQRHESMVQIAPGVKLHVVEMGAPTGKAPVVLIPGWSASAAIWSAQQQALSSGRRVLAFDPRSQGDSTKAGEGNTPEQRARDLRALLEQRRVGRPVLVAWSQGVQDVAAYVAQFGTQEISGIVLVDASISPGAGGVASDPARAVQTLSRVNLYVTHPREYVEGMLRAIIQRQLAPAELDRLASEALKTPPSIGAAMLVADLYGEDRTPALAKFACPTLVLAAQGSPDVAVQREQAGRMPHATFEVMEQSRHAIFIDQPERFTARILRFAEGLT